MSPLYLFNGKLLVRDGSLASNSNCCCNCGCIPYVFSSGLPQDPNSCLAIPYNEKTIIIPENCLSGSHTRVTISGTIDDELIINGQVVQPGEYIGWPDGNSDCFGIPSGCNGCNGYHEVNYSFLVSNYSPSFTIAVGDNHGFIVSADLQICFGPLECSGVCSNEQVCQTGCICYSGNCINDCNITPCGPEYISCCSGVCQPYECDCDCPNGGSQCNNLQNSLDLLYCENGVPTYSVGALDNGVFMSCGSGCYVLPQFYHSSCPFPDLCLTNNTCRPATLQAPYWQEEPYISTGWYYTEERVVAASPIGLGGTAFYGLFLSPRDYTWINPETGLEDNTVVGGNGWSKDGWCYAWYERSIICSFIYPNAFPSYFSERRTSEWKLYRYKCCYGETIVEDATSSVTWVSTGLVYNDPAIPAQATFNDGIYQQEFRAGLLNAAGDNLCDEPFSALQLPNWPTLTLLTGPP